MIKNLSKKECYYILSNNYIGHLGYIDNNRPYVVPVTYFYDKNNNNIICYSGEGHKTLAMRKYPEVSLQVNDINSVNRWQSILLHGKYDQLFGSHAKSQLHEFSLGVKELILHKEMKDLDFISQFSSKIESYGNPIVYTINIEEITGKERV